MPESEGCHDTGTGFYQEEGYLRDRCACISLNGAHYQDVVLNKQLIRPFWLVVNYSYSDLHTADGFPSGGQPCKYEAVIPKG